MNTPALGIDFGGTSIKMGVVSGNRIIATSEPIDTQAYSSRELLITHLCTTINELRGAHPAISAVGVGVPGFVDFRTGTIANLTNVKGWKEVPFKDILEEKLQLPVAVDNDANAMAYAEWKAGAGVGYEDLVAFTLGTGVGGGIIANNQMVRGARCAAGELGQASIHYEGRIGAYGNPGALEDYIGNREIAEDAVLYYQRQGIKVNDLTPKDLSLRAQNGDPIAIEIWDQIAEKLACAMMNCCYLLNPELFVVGGGIAQAGHLLFDPVREKLGKWLGTPFIQDLKIVPAHFGTESGIIGCALLAQEERSA